MSIDEIRQRVVGTHLLQDGKYCGRITEVAIRDDARADVEIMFHAERFPLFIHAPFRHGVLERLAKNGFAESPVSGEENKTTCYKLFRDYEKD